MANFRLIEPQFGMAPVTQTDTVQKWPLGYLARAEDKVSASSNMGVGEFVYCKAGAASFAAAGDFVFLGGNSAIVIGSASSQINYNMGVAAGAFSASNVYGWVQVKGFCGNANLQNATVAAGASAFIGSNTDSNGQIASTQTATGNALMGIHFPNSVNSDSATNNPVFVNTVVYLNYPKPPVGSAL